MALVRIEMGWEEAELLHLLLQMDHGSIGFNARQSRVASRIYRKLSTAMNIAAKENTDVPTFDTSKH